MIKRNINNLKLTADNIEPAGYHLLVELLEVKEESEGGIIMSSGDISREQAAMPVGKLLKIGPTAYKNHDSGINTAEEYGISVGDHVQFPSHVYMKVAGAKSNLVYICDYDIKAKVNL